MEVYIWLMEVGNSEALLLFSWVNTLIIASSGQQTLIYLGQKRCSAVHYSLLLSYAHVNTKAYL